MPKLSGIVREDVRKSNQDYYSLRDKTVQLYNIPRMNYITAAGVNEHNIYKMYEFKEVWTIGRFINRVKHYTKNELAKNFSRMPLEMEWGANHANRSEAGTEFTAMMWVPDYITDDLFQVTVSDLDRRLGGLNTNLVLAPAPERRCAQLLHRGRYELIEGSKKALTDELRTKGLKPKGGIQEIFMNHPYCNPPEKLNILLRLEIEEV